MGTTAVNLQDRANKLVEQAHAFEQAAQNQRWEELAVHCKDVMDGMFAVLMLLRDLDPNLAFPVVNMIERRVVAMQQFPDDEVADDDDEAPAKKEKKPR